MSQTAKNLIALAYGIGLLAAYALSVGAYNLAAGLGVTAGLTAALSGWYEARQ